MATQDNNDNARRSTGSEHLPPKTAKEIITSCSFSPIHAPKDVIMEIARNRAISKGGTVQEKANGIEKWELGAGGDTTNDHQQQPTARKVCPSVVHTTKCTVCERRGTLCEGKPGYACTTCNVGHKECNLRDRKTRRSARVDAKEASPKDGLRFVNTTPGDYDDKVKPKSVKVCGQLARRSASRDASRMVPIDKKHPIKLESACSALDLLASTALSNEFIRQLDSSIASTGCRATKSLDIKKEISDDKKY